MATLGLDYASLAGDQPAADLRVDLRLRADRAGPEQRRLRSGRAGRVRDHVDHGEPGGPPVKAGVPLTDLGAGLFALVGILAALEHRHRTGRGQHVDTSLARRRRGALGLGSDASISRGAASPSAWALRIG